MIYHWIEIESVEVISFCATTKYTLDSCYTAERLSPFFSRLPLITHNIEYNNIKRRVDLQIQ